MTATDDGVAPGVEACVPTPSPLLALPGAVPPPASSDRARDSAVAWHYGDPLREQRRLDEGEGFVDLSHVGVVAVDGPDRLSWLHSLLSQHVEHLEPGVGTEALLLSPHGHVEQHLRLVDDGARTWLITEPGEHVAFAEYLERMRFMLRVEVQDVTGSHAAVWVPRERASNALPTDAVVVPARRGAFVLLRRDELGGAVADLGAPAGLWAHEALRVAAHEPRLGFETDHRTIPHEVGWIGPAVHLQKGCYRGQETVARVQNLGRPPRRLVVLHLDGSTTDHLPAQGSAVVLDGRTIGFVGTAVQHHELGPTALAVVKRSVPVAAVLDVLGHAAAQEVVVAP